MRKVKKKGPTAIKNQVLRFVTGEPQGTQKLNLEELLIELQNTNLPYDRDLERDLVLLADKVLQGE